MFYSSIHTKLFIETLIYRFYFFLNSQSYHGMNRQQDVLNLSNGKVTTHGWLWHRGASWKHWYYRYWEKYLNQTQEKESLSNKLSITNGVTQLNKAVCSVVLMESPSLFCFFSHTSYQFGTWSTCIHSLVCLYNFTKKIYLLRYWVTLSGSLYFWEHLSGWSRRFQMIPKMIPKSVLWTQPKMVLKKIWSTTRRHLHALAL